MKKRILHLINSILDLVKLKLVSSSIDQFTMISGLGRIRAKNIELNSIIDIGASDGKWSLNALSLFPDSHILAIEPLYERDSALTELNKRYPRFSHELCVAGDVEQAQVELNVAADLDGSTVNGTDGKKRKVQQKTIDQLVIDNNLSGPFLLKFDTHGYEVPILEGAQKTLQNTNIIIMEVYNFKITDSSLLFYEMCAHMKKLGFRCYDLVDPMLRDHDNAFWQMDLYFCQDENKIFAHHKYQ